MKLGIFIPAFQAEKTLGSVFMRFSEELWSQTDGVWVIDDGSRDGTSKVAEVWAKLRTQIRVHRFAANQGYGAAVKQGLRFCQQAGVTHAVCLHADGQYPPEEILSGIRFLDDSRMDLLQGSRHLLGTARQGGMPLYKWAAGHVLTWLENRCFGWKMTDYHSGFLIYGAQSLAKIPFQSLGGYFDFDLEVLATARAKGLKVGEMGIPTRYADEVSHLDPLRYGFRVLAVLARYLRGHYARL